MFYQPGCEATLADDQREFFRELQDPDGDYASGREPVATAADFKTTANLVIADATPARASGGLRVQSFVDRWR